MSPPSRLLHETTSLCRACKNAVPARVVATASSEVWLEKTCPEHGDATVRLSTDAAWYERTRAIAARPTAPGRFARPVTLGCPFDCGVCDAHEQRVRLPVVTITSACNLDCPICYVHNKNDGAYHMPRGEFERVLAHLGAEHGELDILNLTGGEPTLHPELLAFVDLARAAGVHRVTVCSNGLRLVKDEAFVAALAERGVRIALSFDTFDPEADVAMQGARLLDTKLRCLDVLERHGVDTTLIPVMTLGYNDHEIGRILDLALSRSNIRHLEVHTITYTGQSGGSFPRSGRISMVEVLDRFAEQTNGLLQRDDWVPSPQAHPLCYQIAYLLLDPSGGPPVPFTRFMPREVLYDCLGDRLYLEPTRKLEQALLGAIDHLWTSDGPESERVLGILKRVLAELFPRDRELAPGEALRVSERASKAIYVHSHMDEDTFDTERLAQCCDSNCYADGTTVPVCAYNVLYREKEDHFMLRPATWNERRGGATYPPVPASRGARRLEILR
ncbi:MAG: radical SAM protein [Myxococcales bacterium]|nr:radical SAM protein [Myxococcales bacterium]